MKKIWVYLLGVLTGVIVTFITLYIIGTANNNLSGLSFFDQPGDIIESSSVKVFQALGDGTALANCKGNEPFDMYGDPIVLLYNEKGFPYYDSQIIKAPKGKCFRQVGIYRYSSRWGDRTVPIVMLLEK